MKTPEPTFDTKLSKDQIREKYLQEGYIDGSKADHQKLEDQMWNKKVSIVFLGGDSPKVYSDLKLDEFGDLKGYGFSLPDKGIFLISRYDRNLKQNLENCLFKIEQV